MLVLACGGLARTITAAKRHSVRGVGSGVVSDRELVVLGTASQAPTRSRNHNGYLLRWDGEGLLFDPGEGTQRQMIFAGVADADAALAREYGHLTAGQAGRIAAEAGARLLVLTHFSQRYDSGDGRLLAGQAEAAFGGEVTLAHDLDRIPVPPRRPPAA
jgi:ribonuclease BN (tRNA processing enzyme)